jgi:NitT/TauT family transport system permease protein
MGKKQRFLLAAGIIVLFFALWEISSRLSLVNPTFVPPFSRVAANACAMLVSGNLFGHIGISLFRSLAGTSIAAVLGIPLGFALALGCERFKISLGTLADVLAQVNPFVLYHILILFMGIGEDVKVTIIEWACLWPVVFNTVSGVENIDRLILKAGRGFGGGRFRLFVKIILPAASPKIFAGIRISAGYSLFILIAAELMGGKSGLGWVILNNQANFQLENIFSIALVIAVLGILLDLLLESVQKRFFPAEIQEYVNSSGA